MVTREVMWVWTRRVYMNAGVIEVTDLVEKPMSNLFSDEMTVMDSEVPVDGDG